MNAAQKDLFIRQIDTEILNKRKHVLHKTKSIETNVHNNVFLEEVKDDYVKYYNYIRNEKILQKQAFVKLTEYMDNLIKTENVLDNGLNTLEQDKKELLGEIDKIKTQLDEITY